MLARVLARLSIPRTYALTSQDRDLSTLIQASAPRPPAPRSRPFPPLIVSVPRRPQMTSRPPPPMIVSSPPRPEMTSRNFEPIRTSLPLPPTIVARRPWQLPTGGSATERGVPATLSVARIASVSDTDRLQDVLPDVGDLLDVLTILVNPRLDLVDGCDLPFEIIDPPLKSGDGPVDAEQRNEREKDEDDRDDLLAIGRPAVGRHLSRSMPYPRTGGIDRSTGGRGRTGRSARGDGAGE